MRPLRSERIVSARSASHLSVGEVTRRCRSSTSHSLLPCLSSILHFMGGIRLLPNKAEARGAWAWVLYGLGPTVVIPVIVVAAIIGTSGKDITLADMGGHGEFAFMAVALAAGAQATVRRSAALKPGDREDPNTLSGLTILTLVTSSAIWGYLTGASDAKQSYNTHFASVIGLILLTIAAIVSIAVAVADAQLMRSVTLTIVAKQPAAHPQGSN